MQNLRTMGLWSAVSIGVGAMIGAGIFALIGIAIVSLLVTAFLVLIFANSFELKNIAELGSIAFLFIYASVNIAHLKLIKQTGAKRNPIIAALLGNIFALSVLLYYVYEHSMLTFIVFILVLLFSYLFESIYLKMTPSKKAGKR